jgi:hypothetical protein
MDDLKEMEEQSQRGASLAAKQAYINALEYRVKELEEGLASASKELESVIIPSTFSFTCSGYYFDHPTLVRLRKLIEKEKP